MQPSYDETRSINLNDTDDVQHWLDVFGVTASQLEEAVRAAGPRAGDVAEHLQNQGGSAGAS